MSFKKKFLILFVCFFLLGFSFVSAQEGPDFSRNIGAGRSSNCTLAEGETNVYHCICQSVNEVEDCHIGFLISNPVCSCCGDCVLNDFLLMGVNAAGNVLGFTGVFALLFFIIGGIIWITSGGSAEKVKKGKDMIKGAIVGLIIVLVAFTVVRVVMEAFGTSAFLPQSSEESESEIEGWPTCPALSDVLPTRPWCYNCVWTGTDKGCQSTEVETYQQKLNNWGCNCGTPDGKFGLGTRDCTRRFQQANDCSSGYCLDVDGMVGPGTRDAYNEILKPGVITNPCI